MVEVENHRRADSRYIYDQNSNRVMGSASGEHFSAIYDNQDRLIRYNNSTYSYNANGDLIGRSDYKGCDFKSKKSVYDNTIIAYDVFGNLKQYGTVTYKIDPLNRRSHRLINGVVTNQYVYNPEGKLIAELDKDGNLTKTFIYGASSNTPDYFIEGTKKYKIISDILGSHRFVVDSITGEVKEKMNHDEFGKIITDTNPNYIPFGFAGGLYDSETKLVNFRNRDYDPKIGRWLSKDPIQFNGGDSNLYGYVFQDPVNLIDSLGLEASSPNDERTTGMHKQTNVGGGGGSTVYVSPNGQAVVMPPGTKVIPANNGNGTVFTPPGSSNGCNVVRLMGPTQMSPNGYGTVQDSGGNYTNGLGKIVPSNSAEAHIQPTMPWEW